MPNLLYPQENYSKPIDYTQLYNQIKGLQRSTVPNRQVVSNIDVNDYYITFDNQTQHIHHEVQYQQHAYDFVKGLNFSNFPVTLNVNNKFKKTYNSPLELRNIMILL